ncbi:SDR family NAD(P)-dependent oxidoreductase [Roseomonas sp. OT10]|uniref:SDR family NAD(P)-dependent oxidoreductase n=1 Tax=Roseomonas cutis TaxID=2897332 RepID=UPI001E459B8A|nr:SDR family NAD(P)-dependent oxidoreductase [Roseomonas sp. OT10]UFN47108.1 SDR family NAD(P)-dependent oxidoreductase [Roseomonas sp. OT10]
MTDPPAWPVVALTGASSGFGAALAEALAAPGRTLHLAGRDAARLAHTAALCRAAGAAVREARFDVRDAAACAAWVEAAGRIDLLIANAGISAGTGGAVEPAEQARTIFEVNLTGALNTALPALARMREQGPGEDGVRGRIAVVASVASFIAAPGAPAYCASKAALQRWAEATDATARRAGVRLHALCPGYIRTPMTAANDFPMPFLMTPETAARRALAGIARGQARIAYPLPLYWMARLGGMVPPRWLSRLPAKATGGPPREA